MRKTQRKRGSIMLLSTLLLLNSIQDAIGIETRIRGGGGRAEGLHVMDTNMNQKNKSNHVGGKTTTNTNKKNGLHGHRPHQRKYQRQHPIKRIFGEDNAAVRAEVHKLETESNQYWRTGIRADPTFEINYGDYHPLDSKRRRLAEGETKENFMKPMRIHWDASALELQRTSSNGDKIDFIKREILPQMSRFWSEALSVVPVDGNLKIQSNELISGFCGDSEFSEVPEEHFFQGVPDADLVLYISGTPSTRFCGPSTLAVAVACNWDQFDRPVAGAINFCVDQIELDKDGTAHPAVIEDNVDVALHEAGHVLGMSSNSYRYFWNPETAQPRTPRPIRASTVTCVDGSTKMTYIPAENTLQFLTGENGVRAATIVTEKVRAIARNQFDCQDLEGAQLEVCLLLFLSFDVWEFYMKSFHQLSLFFRFLTFICFVFALFFVLTLIIILKESTYWNVMYWRSLGRTTFLPREYVWCHLTKHKRAKSINSCTHGGFRMVCRKL